MSQILEIKVRPIIFTTAIICVFVSGFGWGQWVSERAIRKERMELDSGRLVVSMPMDREEASMVFETLKILRKKAEVLRGK